MSSTQGGFGDDSGENSRSESGQTLIEMVVAMALLATVISLFATSFVSGMFSSRYGQLKEVAVTLADSAIDNARAVTPSSSLLSSSNCQASGVGCLVTNPPSTVDLSETSDPFEQSQNATTLDSTKFTTTVYAGTCYLQATQCTTTSNTKPMIRVIAEVTWKASSGCNGTCYYVASSLISNASDPTVETISVPEAPTLESTTPAYGQVTVDWIAPDSNGGSAITGYDVYVGTSSGAENYSSAACTGSSSATTCTVTGLTNGTTYYFTVEAVNIEGDSAASNEESAVPMAVINLSPTSGTVGTSVTITGTGFTGVTINHSSGVTFNGTNVSIGSSNVSIASDGTWSATFTVPNASNGSKTVTATDSSGASASANFVVGAAITLSPTSGTVGTSVTISGTGFTGGGTINHSSGVTFNGTNVSIGSSNVSIASNGTWSATFTVPNASNGYQTVTATDSASESASVNFVVGTAITLSTTSGTVGTSVTISGTGFTGGATINHSSGVTFNGTNVSIGSSNVSIASNGTWSATFTVPNASNGSRTVTATDSSGVSASASFVVGAAITLSTTSGTVGTSVTITGTGFTGGGTINHSSGVTFNGTNVSIGSSNVSIASNGTWSATFTVPNASNGSKTVTGTDSASKSASSSFVVGAAITLSTTSGTVGTSVTITGTGFTGGATINHSSGVTFNGTNVSIGSSNVTIASNGTWSATFTVPNTSNGSKTVKATDSASVSASTSFTYT